MKLNMGCGHNKLQGFINIDRAPECAPDELVDLETIPWPWPSDSVDEVMFHHSLEHMGATSSLFLSMIQELYRVCRHGAEVTIHAPHPRHDDFISDPTHVRIVTPRVMTCFSRDYNDRWKRSGAANTTLAYYLQVDFELVGYQIGLEATYMNQMNQGLLSDEDLQTLLREHNNVAHEFRIQLKVKKDHFQSVTPQ